MERFFAASQDSPLQMLRMLERNLIRERRIFAVVVGLLIFTALCGAGAATYNLALRTLRSEHENAQTMLRNVNQAIFSRFNMLSTAALLLELMNAGSASTAAHNPAKDEGCQRFSENREDIPLLRTCKAALQSIARDSTPVVLLFSSYDGTAAYGIDFLSDVQMQAESSARSVTLAQAAKLYMTVHSISPLDAARQHRVMWFISQPQLFRRPTVVMFMVVAKDGEPYGLVYTRVVLENVLKGIIADSFESQIAIFDANGNALAGNASEYTRHAEQQLKRAETSMYHWMPGFGWGARMDPLALGIGRIVLALPFRAELKAKRTELIIIVLVTTSLIGMLLVMYHFWNHRILTRTYEQACRAVEGEILNHLLVHATPVGLCIALRADFHIVAANQVARRLLDLDDPAKPLPPTLCEVFERNGVEPPTEGAASDIKELSFSFFRPDAAASHLKISYTSAIVNKTDVLFCAIVDVTEQHEVENLLRAAKETSEAVSKAKLSFFASMSHEIRTPLSSLVGNLELVALGPLAAEQEARVQAMQASANALLQVVNDVLDFSKMDIGEMRLLEEWGSIRELVVKVLAAHAPIANRQGLRLFVVIDRTCPRKLFFDPIRLSQILNNLLGNALKFTYSGKIVVRARWTNDVLELSVADSGIGIPEPQQEMLFQPFMQGDSHRLTQARGTGLGLSICVRLCELMKGNIALESTEGVGTRITVSLPLRADEAAFDQNDAPLGGRPAIMCRASEYREWLDSLYDKDESAPTYIANAGAAVDIGHCEYLVVTDEFTDQEIAAVWRDRARVIRLSQSGPLVPAVNADGLLEVSTLSLKGFGEAVQIIKGQRHRGGANAGEAAADAEAFAAPRRAGPTVLIAEDNRLNRSLLRDQLLTLGASVLEAADGEAALEVLRKNRVSIVLTDMDMPKMSGAELLAAIRALDPSMPVYAVSASASAKDVENGRALGFTDYLTKPVPLAVLAGVLPASASPRADAQGQAPQADHHGDDLPPRLPAVPFAYVRDIVQQIDEDIVALDVVCEARDVAKLRRWAHRISGGLSVLGPSMLYDECEELRSLLRETGSWGEDVETFVSLIRSDLIELRDLQHGVLQAQG